MRRRSRCVTPGLEPWSASATAERQTWMADLADRRRVRRQGRLGLCPQSGLADRRRSVLDHTRTGRAGADMSADAGPFEKTPGWLDWCREPHARPAFNHPPARWTRTATSSAPAQSSRSRPSESTPRATQARRSCSRCATIWGSPATSSFRPPATVLTTAPCGRLPRQRRSGPRRGDGPSHRHRPGARRVACAPGCGGCDSTSSSAWSTSRPRDELLEIAARIRPLGWHVVVYFEAQDLPELWEFFAALPTHGGRRPHGPTRRQEADRGAEFRLFLDLMREHRNIWTKVSCPERLSFSGPPAVNGERSRIATSCLSPGRGRGLPGSGVVGKRLAPPEPERSHARRRSAGRLSFRASPSHPSCARSCW